MNGSQAKTRGQLMIPISFALSVALPVLGALGTYYKSQASTDDKIGVVNTNIAVLKKVAEEAEKREEARDKRADRMEDKLDRLLEKNGIKP